MDHISSTTTTPTEYIVLTAAAKMPSSCWGTYRRVAVLEVVRGALPRMISSRARGVVRVVRTWERQHVGSTDRDAYSRAVREARALAEALNAGCGSVPAQVAA